MEEEVKQLIKKFYESSRGDLYDKVFESFKGKYGRKGKFIEVATYSKEYHAKINALLCIDEILQSQPALVGGRVMFVNPKIEHYTQLKEAIEQM